MWQNPKLINFRSFFYNLYYKKRRNSSIHLQTLTSMYPVNNIIPIVKSIDPSNSKTTAKPIAL